MSRVLLLGLFLLAPSMLFAGGETLSKEALSLWWTLPFGGMLLSIVLFPLLSFPFWEAHYGKIVCGWAFIIVIALALTFGFPSAKSEVLKILFHHYVPFIIIIGTLYTIAGGIQIHIDTPGSPLMNTSLLTFGTILAGWVGTTGAAMLLIRPFLKMNIHRKTQVHHMIFFIFLVGNIGGILTPLGDPPLFLGFLNGVNFFWTLEHLFLDMVLISFPLLLLFYGLDRFFVWKEGLSLQAAWPKPRLKGILNGFLFLGVIGLVLLSGFWKPHYVFTVGGVSLELENIIRDGGLLFLLIISYVLTPRDIHEFNHFSWEPLREVVVLFFGIFVTAIPVIAILDAGNQGALTSLISLVSHNAEPQSAMYFWLSGGLSSFLDNAPTYLVFFHMAGGDPSVLMSAFSQTLVAISLGSVFMGALTYIGNAPNFMIKTIAESHKVPMPSFLGYMVWSLGILLPLFFLLSWWRF